MKKTWKHNSRPGQSRLRERPWVGRYKSLSSIVLTSHLSCYPQLRHTHLYYPQFAFLLAKFWCWVSLLVSLLPICYPNIPTSKTEEGINLTRIFITLNEWELIPLKIILFKAVKTKEKNCWERNSHFIFWGPLICFSGRSTNEIYSGYIIC